MNRIKSSDLKLGMRFSLPVFFDDGINMFLAEKKPITHFHLSAIENWKISYVITYGNILKDEEVRNTDENLDLKSLNKQNSSIEKVVANNTLQVIAENLSQVDKNIRETYSKNLKKVRLFFSCAKNNKNISRSEIDITIDEIYKLTLQDSMSIIGYIMSLTPESDLAKNALNSAIFASSLAIVQGLSKREILQIIGASLFHDIGMLSTSEHIMQKKSHLSTSEYNLIKLHPLRSARFASETLFFSKEVSLIIIQHHEYWNGTGYPAGLKENAIEKGARILAIADSFSAMISKKTYRDSLIGYDAIKNLMEDTQKQFDPELIQTFVKMMGAYPIGSIVLLNNTLIGQVVSSNPEMPFMPDIKLLTEPQKNSDSTSSTEDEFHIGQIIKLRYRRNLCIIKVLHPDEYTV